MIGRADSILSLAALSFLAACAGDATPPPARAAFVPIPGGTAGLDRVMGQSGSVLIGLFGNPAADVSEGPARKLQFANQTCVLDAYLYQRGAGTAVVTYLDARRPDGSPIDRASCVGALSLPRMRP